MKHPIDLELFINELKKRQSELLGQFDDLEAELQENQQQLEMAELVRQNYYRHFRLPLPAIQPDEALRRKFAHLSIKDMLVLIATEADGLLDIAEARRVLVRAGVFKDERNATTSIVPVIGRHDEVFRRIGRGLYVLIEKPIISIQSPRVEPKNKAAVVHFQNAAFLTPKSSDAGNGTLHLRTFSE